MGMLLLVAALAAIAAPQPALIAKGLPPITAVVAAPSERDRLYVVGRDGVVRVVARGKLAPRPFLNISAQVATQGEFGLLSIAFDPGYAANHYVYACYTTFDRQ